MKTTTRLFALTLLSTAALGSAMAASVPLLTGDALRDEMIIAQAANPKAAAQPMAQQMPMTQKAAMATPVLQYHATGDALTDEKLFAQQAQARRQMVAGSPAMASAMDGTNRQ